MNKTLITSALPYVNNVPHLGNIIGCVLSADVYARYMREIVGHDNVLYICGTDEYGTTTEVKAQQEGLSCKEICDKYYKLHKQIYEWFNISTDVFGRTTTDTQTEMAQEIFLKLYDDGLLEEKTVQQYYCNTCDKFIADRYIKGFCYHEQCKGKHIITKGDQCDNCGKLIDVIDLDDPFCITCKNEPILKHTDHLFLKLQEFEKELEEYFLDGDKCILSNNALAITKAFIKSGLKSRPITRDLKWGTPIPTNRPGLKKYEGKVMYVWFDAPIGYLSILKHNVDDWEKWLINSNWVQFMAKDNVPFHTVIFPSTLMGFNKNNTKKLPLVTNLSATEYLNYEGSKFSKSENKGIFGDDVMALSEKLGITSDYWRYYLIKIRPESDDSSFNMEDFVTQTKADLVKNFGNFVNRCICLAKKYFESDITFNINNFNDDNRNITIIILEYSKLMECIKLKDGMSKGFRMSEYGNQFLQKHKPWDIYKKYKKTGDKSLLEKIEDIIGFGLYIAHTSCNMLNPIIPEATSDILNYINYDDDYTFSLSTSKFKLPFKPLELDDIKTHLH
jgi:methionyl-tRNA synthetase